MDQKVFDNNDDNDYTSKVDSQVERIPRTIKGIESYDNAGGKLEIVQLDPRPNSNRRARWKEERQIRVWTPPGYHKVSDQHLHCSMHAIRTTCWLLCMVLIEVCRLMCFCREWEARRAFLCFT